MATSKSRYVCNACGAFSAKQMGRCPSCQAWNSLHEESVAPTTPAVNRLSTWAGKRTPAVNLRSVKPAAIPRQATGLPELDRALGGGLVPGSVVLLGGDPGIGKSTLLLQVCAALSQSQPVLYVTGEESADQVALRATRLGLGHADIQLLGEIELEAILAEAEQSQPALMVVDSIQTTYSGTLQSAPGTVAQVRECAAHLTRLAKSRGVAMFLVGHVTKDGSIAGPRVLEHIVDTVLYFEGEQGEAFRMVRAVKNRYGPANELGIFAMGERGLEEVSNPSSLFLTARDTAVSGTCILASAEGNRPLLVEVQALAEPSLSPNAKRSASGVDVGRLQQLLAVLNKHAGVLSATENIYVKVVGGVKLLEPGADLAVLLAAYSSLVDRPISSDTVVFGEIGLAGEVRAVPEALARIKEAEKLGFKQVILPASCDVRQYKGTMTLHSVARVSDALSVVSGRN